MPNISSSNSRTSNKKLQESSRQKDEDNMQWLTRNLSQNERVCIVMVGGRDQIAFRLRAAQSYLRHDLLPSYWSHVMLLSKTAKHLGASLVYEISLDSPTGFSFPPLTNAVQKGRLSQYRDAGKYPNIAILKVPKVTEKEVLDALWKFQMQRTVLDTVDLLARWLGYVWGVSQIGNPLLENYGIPAAAMLEVVFGAVGFDLTPGLESRASCPEAIWQSAKWWHNYYEKQGLEPLSGAYCTDHDL